MKRLQVFLVILATAFIAACGGSSDGSLLNGGTGNVGTSAAEIRLDAVPTFELKSDQTGQDTVIIRALVLNAGGTALAGVAVAFSKTDGDPAIISAPDLTTDDNGIVEARLSNGSSAANRTITVTAATLDDSATDSVDIIVTGTTIGVTGPAALAQNNIGDYVAVLTDSKNSGVAGESLSIASALGNTITAISLTTDSAGKVEFKVEATQGGMDTLTVSGLGINFDFVLDVSDDTFAFTAPALQPDDSPPEIELSSTVGEVVTVNWEIAGAPQAGQQINFTATRGFLSSTADMLTPATSATTDGAGNATLYIASTNAGSALIAATNPNGTTTTRSVEFISVNPNTLVLQAARFTVPVSEQTEVTATVRDIAFNFVKNQIVNFMLVNDITGGSINPASAITDSAGRASTFYTAGSISGPTNGVEIRAEVATLLPVVGDTVQLTVASKEFDLVIGTGNDIFEPTTASFAQEWNVFVTDSVGNAVQNKSVQVAIRSMEYLKGELFLDLIDGAPWRPAGPLATCPEEDGSVDGVRNSILDPGEDGNGSGQIEAGNVAVVAPVLDSAPANDPCSTAGAAGTSAEVTTNAQGIARVCVFWPQDHSWWVNVQIEAKTGVTGSESSAQQVFLLPVLADDINQENIQPPNRVSPFGVPTVAGDCSEPPPGLPFP